MTSAWAADDGERQPGVQQIHETPFSDVGDAMLCDTHAGSRLVL